MSLFTPVTGLLGGSLIGISASVLLLFNGNIMGAAGIVSSFINSPRKTITEHTSHWKVVYMASFLVTAKLFVNYVEYNATSDPRVGFDPELPIVSALGHAVAGFLVGFGTTLGNGCTTGHGICGLARFSKRSLAAVLSFMSTGIIAATICSPTCPLAKFLRAQKDAIQYSFPTNNSSFIGSLIAAIFVGASIPVLLRPQPLKAEAESSEKIDEEINCKKKLLPAMVSSSIFAIGLAISRMTLSSKIYGFLDMSGMARGTYDPTLITVMGGGLIWSFLSYQFVRGWNIFKNPYTLSCPISQKKSCGRFDVPSNRVIDSQLIIGEAIFGLGWGIGGLCPGPAMFLVAAGFPHVIYRFWPAFCVGSIVAKKIKDKKAST